MVNAQPRKYVIVGAVAGGAAAAARLRRLDESASIIVLDKGPDPSFANCGMPYYIGGEIADRHKLNVQTPASLKARLNLDVRVRTEVLSIDPAAKTVRAKNLVTGEEYTESYDALTLSMGAKPFAPPIPGIDRAGNFALRNLEDMDRIKAAVSAQGAKTAVVAGGGFIGIEMAEQLRHLGMTVAIVEALPQLMAPFDPEMASLLTRELEAQGVAVHLNAPIKAFQPRSDGAAQGSDVVLSETSKLPADVIILGLGVRADTALAKSAGVALNARGGIVVNPHMRTSDESIWAVGDAVEVRNPVLGGEWMVALAGPAARQGRTAADNMAGFKKDREYAGTIGSSAVRVFGLTAAGTGQNERGLQMAKKAYAAVHLHPNNHAGYFPGASAIALKVLFSTEAGVDEGRVLGAQAVGRDGADKAIDAIAVAVTARMTVHDLADLELCYAPPVGSAKSPVNYAGMIAQDMLEGLVETVQWHEYDALADDEAHVQLVDVRGVAEIERNGAIHPRAMCLPLDEIRSRLGELPRDKTLVVNCHAGQRGYYACRVLSQEGFKVKNLDGGFTTYMGSPLAKRPHKA